MKSTKKKVKSKKKGAKKNGKQIKDKNGNGKKNNNGNGANGNGKLLIKEKLFVEEYLKDFNATRAYRVVHGNRMKDESAWVLASETLRKVKVMSEIDRRITELFEKLEVSNELLIASYINQALCDIRPLFDNGVFIGINNLNIAQQSVIESIETDNIYEGRGDEREVVGYKTKIRFYSRKAAMDTLMKYKGLIRDTINNNTIILGNKTEVIITAAKELKETLGDSRVTELNKLLTKQN